jgi:6,7-dimethyl-8-ribityllumazine synthase
MTDSKPQDPTIKGLEPPSEQFDGSKLRIGIVHARWNRLVIDALVHGAVDTLKGNGVLDENIVIATVPGSFELPFAVSKLAVCLLYGMRG